MSAKSRISALFVPTRDTGVTIWPWNDLPAGMVFPDGFEAIRTANWVVRIPNGSNTPFNVRAGDIIPWLGDVTHRFDDKAGSVTLVVGEDK